MYNDFKGQVKEGFLEEAILERNSEEVVHQVFCDTGKESKVGKRMARSRNEAQKSILLPGSIPS